MWEKDICIFCKFVKGNQSKNIANPRIQVYLSQIISSHEGCNTLVKDKKKKKKHLTEKTDLQRVRTKLIEPFRNSILKIQNGKIKPYFELKLMEKIFKKILLTYSCKWLSFSK